VFEDRQGRIWAGTSRGLSLHRPEVDRDPPHTLLKLVNNPGEAPSSGNVRILFAGLDKFKQTPAERLLFSYRLDGGPWSRFNSADFTALQKLGHGRHRMEVRAMDRNGNTESVPDRIEFNVAHPWFEQTGFVVLSWCAGFVILSLMAMAAMSYRQRGRLVMELSQAQKAAETATKHKST
jgi:hypothetical protein